MLRQALRIVAGFAAACLAAGATQVLFVIDPVAAFSTREGAAAAVLLVAMAATQAATFAFPFAVLAIGLSELCGLRGWPIALLWGVLIAVSGYAAVTAGEEPGFTLRNDYALWAFLTSGAVAGLAYWLVAGRPAREARAKS